MKQLLIATAIAALSVAPAIAVAPLNAADKAKLRQAERTCKHVEEWMHRYSNKILRCPGQEPMIVTAQVRNGKVVPVYKTITCRGIVNDSGVPMRVGSCALEEGTVSKGAAALDSVTETCPNGTKCEFRAEVDPIGHSRVLRIVGSVHKVQ
jgi:hypothetical protein